MSTGNRLILHGVVDAFDAETLGRIAFRHEMEFPGRTPKDPVIWVVPHPQGGERTYFTQWTKGGSVHAERCAY